MKKNKLPLLSILVPTRNRDSFAFFTAKQILSLSDENIQLIIQNNSDSNRLKEMLLDYKNDNRLKYNYSPVQLSFVDNFSKAVSMADGEYICAIGDDDGINPEIMKIVSWAKEHEILAIKPELRAIYIWPETGIFLNNRISDNGILNISKITCSADIYYTKKELIKLMKYSCQNYLERNLVKLYHGIVKKEFVEKVKELTGNYFGGLSPDIYSSVALSTLIERVIRIDYPLTISGICKKSGSADSVTGRHIGKLEDAPHFKGHDNYFWADEVPRFYSVGTIWADSALAAIKILGILAYLITGLYFFLFEVITPVSQLLPYRFYWI